ncbi:MAG: polysaccharide deacetylase family protein [Planctomycetaceae bacterium]|nr:polysaccharide deacetylase family protein [Planctomycetaceae bacterium]
MNKRDLAVRAVNALGLHALSRHLPLWRGLLVFNYHRIGTPAGSPFDWELWSATAEDFDAQVAHLVRDFDVIGPDDLQHALGTRTRGRCVMLTFDDGYRDNYEIAFPILKQHRTTATFFVTTGFLDEPRLAWWDEIAWMVRTSEMPGMASNEWTGERMEFDAPARSVAIRRLLEIYKQLDGRETDRFVAFLADATGSGRARSEHAADLWMTWDMVREMRHAGMSFGGHTVTHPVLSRLDADAQSREIRECKRRIECELGEPINTFSYPVGGRDTFNAATRNALRTHGFRWAFSYHGGYAPTAGDQFDIPRTAVERDVTLPRFGAVSALPQLFA